MNTSRLGFAGLFSIVALTACGGGGGSSSSPNPTPAPPPEPTSLEILSNPLDYSIAQLDTAAKNYANSSYTGKSNVATADIDAVQNVYIALFGEDLASSPYLDVFEVYDFADDNGNIDGVTQCSDSGSITYSGKLDLEDGTGTIVIDYDQCIHYYLNKYHDGQISVAITQLDDNNFEATSYFTSLSIGQGSQRATLKGLIKFALNYHEFNGNYSETYTQYLTATFSGETYKIIGTAYDGIKDDRYTTEYDGTMHIGSKGKLDFSYISEEGGLPYAYQGSLVVKGDKTAGIDIMQGAVRYGEDTDGDDTYDVGVFFSNIETFASSNTANIVLSDIETISAPPVVSEPYYYAYEPVYTSDDIIVEQGYYYDPDTPDSDLSISYRWYINNNVVDGVNGTTLPAYNAVFGDELKVTMVVSDGSNIVESQPVFITISDSPMTLTVSNMPDSVVAGGYVEFTVSMTDPDRISGDAAGQLVSAPTGVTLSDEGLLTWQVPEEQLFNEQTYVFSFASLDGVESLQTVEITSYADKAPAFARTTSITPVFNQGFALASVDGVNELITVSHRNVGAFSLKGNTLENTYVYPYKLPTRGEIKGVYTQDVDGDGNDEIYILTEQGLSVIKDRNNNAEAVFVIEGNIGSGWLFDIDSDGVGEIAYLHGNRSYDMTSISIHDVTTGEKLQQYDIDGVSTLSFGNVDDDASIEMVTNNGYVFDIESGANQWLLGSGFSDAYVVVGDMNNDGIDEIIGADYYENISVYSAVSKSSLATATYNDICDMSYTKDDATNEGMVVISECQWGEIKALTLEGSQISEQWSINHNTYSGISLLIGDLSNDNSDEIIWVGDYQILVAQQEASGDYVLSDIKTEAHSSHYFAAGWAPFGDNDERAVFVSNTNNYDTSIQILSVDKEDNITVSEELGDDAYDYSRPVVTDYNNDGVGELLTGALDYNSSFNVIQLSDNSTQWTLSQNHNSQISLIEAVDVNEDGFIDAVVIENDRLKAYDIENQILVDSIISDFSIVAVAELTNNGEQFFAVSGYESLKLYKMQEGEFIGLNELQTVCSQLLRINSDSDDAFEFACLDTTHNVINIYDVTNDALVLKDTISLTFYPQNIAVIPTTSSNQSILGIYPTNEYDSSYGYYDNINYRVAELDSKGNVIWRSPSISIDNVDGLRIRKNNANKVELQIGNPNMALLVK